MVIDSSALLAVLLGEPQRAVFLDAIAGAATRYISTANVLETGIVIEARRGESAGSEFDLFLKQAGIEPVPVDIEQIEIARMAWRKFGKGRHPAGLNFGDCFAYALAKWLGEPLLAAGADFSQTDIEAVR